VDKIIAIDKARQMARDILRSGGFANDEIAIIAEHLIECELTGHYSHGLFTLDKIVKHQSAVKNAGEIKTAAVMPNILSIDGGRHNGVVVLEKAVSAILEKMTNNPMSMVAVKNYSGNTGVIGSFARKLARAGLVSLFFCASSPRVAPHGGASAVFGTNPITAGFPCGGNPVIVDTSTSAMTYRDISVAATLGKSLPDGVILNKDGVPSNDPKDEPDGVLLPLAGHKGFSMGLTVDMFANILTGAGGKNDSTGVFIIVQKPDLFISKEQYAETIKNRLGDIKKSKLAFGADNIRIPGDRYNDLYNENLKKGVIAMPQELYDKFAGLHAKCARGEMCFCGNLK
jgi:LDH2 family malate/lactate/ureidoglycolate dehydrogenase